MGKDYAKFVQECLTVQLSVDQKSNKILFKIFSRKFKQLSNISNLRQNGRWILIEEEAMHLQPSVLWRYEENKHSSHTKDATKQ
jgi:hypothetical protein